MYARSWTMQQTSRHAQARTVYGGHCIEPTASEPNTTCPSEPAKACCRQLARTPSRRATTKFAAAKNDESMAITRPSGRLHSPSMHSGARCGCTFPPPCRCNSCAPTSTEPSSAPAPLLSFSNSTSALHKRCCQWSTTWPMTVAKADE
eukprot:SAG11_NODE_4014_length_2107_cov_1.057769_2_plen_148_part_00